MSYFGRGVLLGAIRAYRRWLSGRGPLRRVVCTFCASESCSAYGLRVVGEVGGLSEALRLIRGRLRRCREASAYRFADGWGWGECYDAADGAALEGELEAARELPQTAANVLLTAALVARHRGDEELVADCAARARRLGAGPKYVTVRDGSGLERRLRRSLRRRLLFALGVAAACWLCRWRCQWRDRRRECSWL